MISEFNVLNREQNIHTHCLLEASAGTGKTFAVENLVVRLLLEEGPTHPPLSLDQILVVTFTRAATRDLKKRIRSKIVDTLEFLTSPHSPSHKIIPDYLQKIADSGEEQLTASKRVLERALFCFDQAQIFTIHGFCHRILNEYFFESGVHLESGPKETNFSTERGLQVLQDYFRSQVHSSLFSHQQFAKLANCQEKLEKLKQQLLKTISQCDLKAPPRDFHQQLSAFHQVMADLRQRGYTHSSKIVEDFIRQAPNYTGICDKQGNIKPENFDKVQRFANLFDRQDWSAADFDGLIQDGLYFFSALAAENLKAKKKTSLETPLHYPSFLKDIQYTLNTLVEEAQDPDLLYMRLAYHSQKYLQRYFQKEEIRNYDSLLKDMHKAAHSPAFVDLIEQKYKAAIIDEFQDTDPLQWDIFEKLFLKRTHSWGYLYLVGDPKQAIYSFRHADIYTYLKAGDIIGSEKTACLSTNFRSQKKLVEALNFLFSACTQMIHLPRQESHLPYLAVKAGEKHAPIDFNDSIGSVHFLPVTLEKKKSSLKDLHTLETDHFFPYIIQQILSLQSKQIEFNQMAVLVADRYQCHRMSQALALHRIPCITQHQEHLADSLAVAALKEILSAVLSPKDEGLIKIALASPIIGWSHDKISLLNQSELLEEIVISFFQLHTTWMEDGFSSFLNSLLGHKFSLAQCSVAENLVAREEGLEIYQDLLQIADILIEQENHHHYSPHEVISFLDNFVLSQAQDEQAIKCRPNPDLKGVHILTTHSSKGLEYDIVFALGLSQRTRQPEKKRLDTSHYPPLIVPISNENSQEYLEICQEADAEKMRLLYVALTRAKQRLYIPAVFFSEEGSLKPGTASPLELYLARLNATSLEYTELYKSIQQLHPAHIERLIEQAKDLQIDITATPITSIPPVARYAQNTDSPEITPPVEFHIPGLPLLMHSYSSLTKPLKSESLLLDIKPPSDINCMLKTPHTLPSGAEIGLLLHKILENVPLGCIDMLEIKKILFQELRGSSWAAWSEVIEAMILKALTYRFSAGSKNFCLAEIDPNKTYRETEFLFPWLPDLQVDEVGAAEGLLKGVIDLIFEHNGLYYILDWKSNWLGPSCEHYTHEHLQQAMHKHHYFIQARIYQEALKKYLNISHPKSFEEVFGGIIYVFLRGLDTNACSQNNSSPTGVYMIKPGLDG